MTNNKNEITAEDFGLRDDENKRELNGEDCFVPTFDPVLNPTIRITDIRSRRFNVIDAYQSASARQEIQSTEDARIFEALRDQDGYHMIGSIMAEPIRRYLDYPSIARSIFPIETISNGAAQFYTRNENQEDEYRREVLAEWNVDNDD